MCELDDSTPETQRGARGIVKCKRECFMIVNIHSCKKKSNLNLRCRYQKALADINNRCQ